MRLTPAHREVQLLGQIVNHYQAPDDSRCDFAALLERLSAINGLKRIRFASPHPRHVTPRMIAAMRDLPTVCRHLHLPVQSGSTRILAAMRRRHTREHYLDLVDALREAMPDIALSTDMIVGFPGEAETDFEETMTLVEKVRYHSMFSFKYSERPNTLASKRLPDGVIGTREDYAHRRPAGIAEADSGRTVRSGCRSHIRRARRFAQPPPRVGALGSNQRKHGGELQRQRGRHGSACSGPNYRREPEQPSR